jgi:hypothetical protein
VVLDNGKIEGGHSGLSLSFFQAVTAVFADPFGVRIVEYLF